MMWSALKGLDENELVETRKYLHQAIQIVGAAPRRLLENDPTDATASLDWNPATKSLESQPLETGGNLYRVGFQLETFKLFLREGDKTVRGLEMGGKRTQVGLIWLIDTLSNYGFDSERIDLELPYEIEAYDPTRILDPSRQALEEFASLFDSSFASLMELKESEPKAWDTRCWPHHFDLATLLPLKTSGEEVTNSIGIGFSPGDDGHPSPYIYVNHWPNFEYERVSGVDLPNGFWNKEGWSGSVLSYSEMVAVNGPDLIRNFIERSISVLQAIDN